MYKKNNKLLKKIILSILLLFILAIFLINVSCIVPESYINKVNLNFNTYFGFLYFCGIKNVNQKIGFQLVFKNNVTNEKKVWDFNLIGKKNFYYFPIKPGEYTLAYKFKNEKKYGGEHTVIVRENFLNLDIVVLYSKIKNNYISVSAKPIERKNFKNIKNFDKEIKPFLSLGINITDEEVNLNSLFPLDNSVNLILHYDDSIGYFDFNGKKVFNNGKIILPFSSETVFPFQVKGKFVINREFRLSNKLVIREIPFVLSIYGKYYANLIAISKAGIIKNLNISIINKESIINYSKYKKNSEMKQTMYGIFKKELLPYISIQFYYE